MSYKKVIDDNKAFFVPERDFPILGGDKIERPTRSEILSRTPLGREQSREFQLEKELAKELIVLEGRESERAYNHYLKFRNQLSGVSQRIYFLRLKGRKARDRYLQSLGLVGSRLSNWTQSEDVYLGMDKTTVRKSWGEPAQIDIAGNPRYENERWLFRNNGRPMYLYFERGIVQGWTTP